MKTLKLFTCILFVSLALMSCKKDDEGGDGGAAAEGTITAKIGGADFTSLEIATTANEVTAGGSTTITIQGNDASGKAIILIINGYDGTGTYEISDAGIFNTATYTEANISNPQATQSWVAPFANSGVAGEINISSKTADNIQGTFNFEGKNNDDMSMRSITEGSFNMTLLQNGG